MRDSETPRFIGSFRLTEIGTSYTETVKNRRRNDETMRYKDQRTDEIWG